MTAPVTTLNSNGNVFAGGGWDSGLPAPGTDGVIGGNGTCGAFDLSTPFDFAKDGLAVTVTHTAGAITSGGGPGDWAAKNSGSAFYYWCQSGGSLSVPRSIVMGDHLHYTLSNTGTLGATQQTGGFVGPVGSGTFTQTGGTVLNSGYRAGNGSTLSLSGGAGSNIGWAKGSAYELANNASARIDISGNYTATIDPSINPASVVVFDSAGTGSFVLETTWTGSLTRDNFTKADWITALAKTGVMVGTTQVTPGNFDLLLEVQNAGAPGSRVSLAGPPPPATITWGAAHNITGDSDVLKTGTLVYAYAFGNAAATVNNVPFTLGTVSGGGTDVTFGYISASYSGAYFGPDAGLSAAYNTILTGANWTYTAFPLTLNHLTPGIDYTVQVWSNNNNVNTGPSDYTSLDGAVSLLGKMAANGNRGQYATGTFTASSTSQVIAVGGVPQELINAIQVRTAPDPGIPTISITSPTDGAAVAAGADITITAEAADDGTITRVSFYDGTTQLGADDTTAPYTYVWSGAAAGLHKLTAKVWDNTGLSATSAEVKVTVTADTTPPGVITWGAAHNITAASDVLTTGTAVYAYAFGTDVGPQTVNTVAFSVGTISGGGTNVTVSGASLTCGAYFPLSSPPSYNGILRGAVFASSGTGATMTVTLNHLVEGVQYAVQVWSGNVDYGGTPTTYDGAVSLTVSPTGQYAIGTFTADASGTQAMILTANNIQINALQVRTVVATTTLVSPLGTSKFGDSVTLTATVTPMPTGTVQFYDNGAPIGPARPVTAGVATYDATALTVGPHLITATFTGTIGFATSKDLVGSTQTVNPVRTAYAVWTDQITNGKTGPNQDADADGVPNFIEFAFNGNPNSAASTGMVYSSTEASAVAYPGQKVLVLTVAVRAGGTTWATNTATIDGITYTIEGSTTLDNFSSSTSRVVPFDNNTGPTNLTGTLYEWRRFMLTDSAGLYSKGFLRAKVEQ